MKKPIHFFLLLWIVAAAFNIAFSNNVNVTNVTVTGRNTTAGVNNAANYALVQFDITWENSWRTSSAPNNWDAAWVFVKYKVSGGEWNHAKLNATGHVAPTGSTITPASDGTGAFIYRSENGTGTFSKTGVQLRWNYGLNSVADEATMDIQVFAIEMVYVPQGAFSLGSGGSDSAEFYQSPSKANVFPVISESAINVGSTAGYLFYSLRGSATTGSGGDTTGPIPASYPKGYNAFYCMKYEISQQQYVEFLNTLTYVQQSWCSTTGVTTAANPGLAAGTLIFSGLTYRNGIVIQTPGVATATPAVYACNLNGNTVYGETDDGKNVSCNYLNWHHLASFLDWSGLRPMSELEYEKACRGTIAAVPEEYAWGSTSMTANAGLNNPGMISETGSTAGANIIVDSAAAVHGPMRVGAFATTLTDRQSSGATYYGIMDMCGNVTERVVNAGYISGRSFTGLHGDGILNTIGEATTDYWPGINGNLSATTANNIYGGTTGVKMNAAAGGGYKGGHWNRNDALRSVRVSDRFYGARNNAACTSSNGGRGVRTAP